MAFIFARKFYVADTHFGHSKIIGACSRPFAGSGEMDEAMIRRWNDVVKPNDIVYHLGDFSMGLNDPDRVGSIFARLMGRKRLILGNHDYKKANIVHPTLTALDWDEPPREAVETTDDGQRVFLSHYAHRVWPGHHQGSYHFFGHSHGSLPSIGRSRDVGVDMDDVDFAPHTFAQLTKGMSR